MVRRRTRATKLLTAPLTSGGVDSGKISSVKFQGNTNINGNVATAVSNSNLLEDHFFASPKRKDSKLDSIQTQIDKTNDVTTEADAADNDEELHNTDESQKAKVSSSGLGKVRSERNSGRTIGVPLATRSQTRTIEHFFKANTAAKSAKIKAEVAEKQYGITEANAGVQIINNENGNNSVNMLAVVTNGHCKFPIESAIPYQCQQTVDTTNIQPEFFFDLSEDTNDTDHTELSDEFSAASGASSNVAGLGITNANFETHRSPLRDSHSSRSSTTDNIFLQEPVLTLDVDKSPNQASSIKINKTIEIEPIFSSPPAISATAFNGRFSKIVSLNGTPSLRDSFGFEKQHIAANAVNSCLLNLADNDNSSCDSGVAFGSNSAGSNTFDINSPEPIVTATAAAVPRRRKPATPHRIVCPSPIKAPPRMVSPVAGVGKSNGVGGQYSPSGRKISASKEQLSPRKSPRHLLATACSKTRRRLNQPKEHKAPYQIINQTMQNGYIKDGYNDDAADDDDLEFENLADSAAVSIPFYEAPPKMFLNQTQTKNSTAQQQNHRITNKKHKAKSSAANGKVVTTAAAQQSKTKLHLQAPHPLAATNGNRELSEFFPVRRSVRKTKTAVKEEMMRSLEQAILEERCEGLKIAHFENKGRGVVADRRFERSEFVIEYVGDLISMTEAAEREKRYALDENAGCYMYYFKHKNQQYCIDATIDTGKFGRLVNHSRNGNLITKVVVVKQRPHLILIAKDDIEPGEELTYDYGDRSKESLLHHPWLAF